MWSKTPWDSGIYIVEKLEQGESLFEAAGSHSE